MFVVSESAAVRERASSALRARPEIEVDEVASVPEAHRRLAEDQVDVVVMDGDMRPEGGYSVAYEIRAAAELRGEAPPPVVMLIEREQDRWLASWAGAVAAFEKPVNPFELAERVVVLGERVPEAPAG